MGDKPETRIDFKDLSLSGKSLKILALCVDDAYTKKELLLKIGVTAQKLNVRNIINPLISAGCLTPHDEDHEKVRNVMYCITARGIECLRFHAAV